jgi:hypothetical protein
MLFTAALLRFTPVLPPALWADERTFAAGR